MLTSNNDFETNITLMGGAYLRHAGPPLFKRGVRMQPVTESACA